MVCWTYHSYTTAKADHQSQAQDGASYRGVAPPAWAPLGTRESAPTVQGPATRATAKLKTA